MTNLTRREKETIARFSEDPEDLMTFETFNQRHALRLIKAGATVKRTNVRGKATYWTLEMPREWFRWPRPKKTLSAEEKARRADSLAKARAGSGADNKKGDPE